MRKDIVVAFLCLSFPLLVSCTHVQDRDEYDQPGGGYNNSSDSTQPNRYTDSQNYSSHLDGTNFAERMPQHQNTNGKKMVLVDPNVHAWGAYDAHGDLVKAGIATAGGAVCPPDAENESDCRTGAGTFHIAAMRGEDCYSKTYPRPHGGGLMPYCMYFNKGQALHGSPDNIVVENNISHGCVRMRIQDAEWMWGNFANVGTTVKVIPYQS